MEAPLTEERKVLYEERIRDLEENVTSLRLSRRILMDLLERSERERATEEARLNKENARLRRQLLASAFRGVRDGREQSAMKEEHEAD